MVRTSSGLAPRTLVAASTLNRTKWAVPTTGSYSIGRTPQLKANLRHTSFVEQSARIGILGRWHATRRGVLPDAVAAIIALAVTEFAMACAACATAASRSVRSGIDGGIGSSPVIHDFSARAAIVAMVETASTGNRPTADSAESMTASLPSRIALAMSAASALVGL